MTDLTVRDPIDAALDIVSDISAPLEDRAAAYAALYRVRRAISRRFKQSDIATELQLYMERNRVREFGPIRLSWRSFDVAYPCNDPGNYEDAGVQEQLSEWATDPQFGRFIREVPRHFEVVPAAIGEAFAMSDPYGREFVRLLDEYRYRTAGGRAATLTVREPTHE